MTGRQEVDDPTPATFAERFGNWWDIPGTKFQRASYPYPQEEAVKGQNREFKVPGETTMPWTWERFQNEYPGLYKYLQEKRRIKRGIPPYFEENILTPEQIKTFSPRQRVEADPAVSLADASQPPEDFSIIPRRRDTPGWPKDEPNQDILIPLDHSDPTNHPGGRWMWEKLSPEDQSRMNNWEEFKDYPSSDNPTHIRVKVKPSKPEGPPESGIEPSSQTANLQDSSRPPTDPTRVDPTSRFAQWLGAQPKTPERGLADFLGAQPVAMRLGRQVTGGGVPIGERMGSAFTVESASIKDIAGAKGKHWSELDWEDDPTRGPYRFHRFTVRNEKGTVVGEFQIDIDGTPDQVAKAKTAHVGWATSMGQEADDESGHSWTIGPRAIFDIIRQLKKVYPNLQTLESERVTGGRAESGKAETKGGQKATFDISKYAGVPWIVLPSGAIAFGTPDEAEAAPGTPQDRTGPKSGLLAQVGQALMSMPEIRGPAAIGRAVGQVGKERLDELVGSIARSLGAEAEGAHSIPDLMNLAGTALLGGPPISRAAGTVGDLGVFAGVRSRPTGVPASSLENRLQVGKVNEAAAETGYRGSNEPILESVLKDIGLSREAVWKETGWFQDSKGNWKFEIPDKDVERIIHRKGFSPDGSERVSIPLSNVIRHENLFKAYPQLRNLRIDFDPSLNHLGQYDRGKGGSLGSITLKADPMGKYLSREETSTLLHELQHAIQDIEGFPQGGSTETIKSLAFKRFDQMQKDPNTPPEVVKRLMRLHMAKGDPRFGKVFSQWYRGLPGETEARNVEDRWQAATEKPSASKGSGWEHVGGASVRERLGLDPGTDPYSVPPWQTEQPGPTKQFDWVSHLVDLVRGGGT